MSSVQRIEIDTAELKAIMARARSAALTEQDLDTLDAVLHTLGFVTSELEKKGASIRRLRKLIFGAGSEKMAAIFGKGGKGKNPGRKPSASADGGGDNQKAEPNDPGDSPGSDADNNAESKPKRAGHGRNGADTYTGAETIDVTHDTLTHGDLCPDCEKGKVYDQAPAVIVRVRGQAPLGATVYKLDRLRCNLCGVVVTAPSPPGVGDQKYDESAASMIALLKYGAGLPFNRLDRLQDNLGIPLPSSTQWDIIEPVAAITRPVFDELIKCAAQGKLLHNDDTNATILSWLKQLEQRRAAGNPPERTGVFTSAIVSIHDDRQIALFFTSNLHAGENLEALLQLRAKHLDPPIQMCDALSRNLPKQLATIVANCIAHARRRFVHVVDNFPDECRYVLEVLRDVYKNDADAKKQSMSAQARLAHHQAHSAPLMDELHDWLTNQFKYKLVEPNSSLGDAITYMLKHWHKLTLFLKQPGAPLDNNICERALKKAILHRRNSLFYKTENGALVGDILMSLIYTCELARANPFDYLTQLQRHAYDVAQNPAAWLPSTYRDTLAARS